MADAERIAGILNARRGELGLSQEAAAQKIGTSVTTYSRWERALVVPNTVSVDAIARAFEIDASLLRPSARNLIVDETVGHVLDEMREEMRALAAGISRIERHLGIPEAA